MKSISHSRPAQKTLEDLLKRKSFDQLLKDGDIFDIEVAAAKTGYSPQHLRRLCAGGKIGCIARGDSQYYFLPEHITAIFSIREPRPEPKKA